MPSRRFAKVGFALLVAGAGFAWIGLRYGGPSTWAALTLFGLAAAFGGVHSVVTRRHRSAQGSLQSELAHQHRGAGAVLLGVTMLVPGLVMVVAGVAGVLGLADGLGVWASARPGVLTMAAGAWAVLGGVGLLISRWTYEHQPTHWWQRLPGQLVGLAVVAIGVGLLAVGGVLAQDPADPRAALGRVAEWVVRLLAGQGAD